MEGSGNGEIAVLTGDKKPKWQGPKSLEFDVQPTKPKKEVGTEEKTMEISPILRKGI
jgi:hypothetical protein